jgi:hypothetical protein
MLSDFYKGAQWCKICRKQWNLENSDKIKEYIKNKDTSEIQKRFYNKNKQKFFEYKKQKRKNDPIFKLIENTRKRIYSCLKKNKKTNRSIEYLGCPIEKYKQYLESLFTPEMNWGNYGKYWEIDHIVPLFSFNFENNEEKYKAFHYYNTRPLSKIENQKRPKKL